MTVRPKSVEKILVVPLGFSGHIVVKETEKTGHSGGCKSPEHQGSAFPQGIVEKLYGAVTDWIFGNNLKRVSVDVLMGNS
ncbi:MAG: hypothetical protein WBB23_03355 [Desulforhopalus sp.]